LLLLRNADAKRSVSHTRTILILGTVLGVLTAGAAGWSVLRDDSRRRLAETTLRAVNQELEEFAYAASHDLKAPLRVIDNASQWLEEDLQEHLSGESRESMKLLRGRVMRMEKLLDDLLEYSRIGRKTDQRHVEIISGDVLLDNILTLLSPPEGFAVSASPRFSEIQVYRMPLQQILMNLVGNAIKHHDKSTGRIEITVHDRGVDYAFAVSDDGPGIPAQFQEQVFRMFQTLRPRDQVEGSGMGLAMVRKNIELVGGTIKLESANGRGSKFSFTLPKPLQVKRGYA
jgi:signal transduction histidine kinase